MAEVLHPELDNLPAVLNLQRIQIQGPDLLDQLVSTDVPDHIAIEYLEKHKDIQRFSYRWLHHSSDILASQLASELEIYSAQYVNTVIPILIPQCPSLYVSYLAVLKLGHAFCPINGDIPPDRLKFIVKDVGANLVLCLREQQGDIQSIIPGVKCFVPTISDGFTEPHSATSHLYEKLSRQGSDIAYIMYTSGSTGLPKAVVISHHSVSQALLAHDEHIPVFNKFLQFASPSFDVSVFEIFFPLYRGATLACCERELMLTNLPLAMKSLNVDIAELTPSVAANLLRTRSAAPCLRYLLTIGEPMNQHTLNEFGGSTDRESMLYALYGPTEASIHCTVLPRMCIADGSSNIGHPFSTVTALILAEDKSDGAVIVQRGVRGELAVAGQLAAGYLNRSDETTAAFIHLPGYGDVYRTGDRALITTDGFIQIYGRIKDGQVKIRGQRVELGEIEAAASKAKGVEVAVAMMIDPSLIVFCFGAENMNEESIHKVCNAWLPRHMRPSTVLVCHDGLPRLSSGKVDRQQLASRYKNDFSVSNNIESNMTAFEKLLIDAFSAKCHQKFYLDTSFNNAGIDSLKAITIASDLRQKCPSITMKAILQADNVTSLAEQLSTHPDNSDRENDFGEGMDFDACLPELEQEVRAALIREHPHNHIQYIRLCSEVQLGMITETLRNPLANYNTIRISLSQGTTERHFSDAFAKIISENEILRSGIMLTSSEVSPVVIAVRSCIDPGETPSLWDPLTWRHGQASGLCEITITIHHALYDGWSWDLIMRDLNMLLTKQKPSVHPQYEALRRWQQKRRDTLSSLDIQHWTDELATSSPSIIPCLCSELPREAKYEVAVSSAVVKLSIMKSLAQSLKISAQAIFQACVTLLMSTYLESSEVITGFVASGRDAAFPGIEEVLGPCLSTYPLRIDVAHIRTMQDLLISVHRKQGWCLDHANCSMQQLKQTVNLSADQNLFDVICAWQESIINLNTEPQVAQVVQASDSIVCTMLVEAEPDRTNDSVNLKCTFKNDRIPLQQAKVFLQQLGMTMQLVVGAVHVKPPDMLGQLHQELLSVSNPYPHDPVIYPEITATVAKLAALDPDRIAVEHIDDIVLEDGRIVKRSLTYFELHERGRNLANTLSTEHNIGVDDIICIWLPKSLDLYLLIYAAIEGGAAYICIDPDTPDRRTNTVLREAHCKLLILPQERQFIPTYDICVVSERDLIGKSGRQMTQTTQMTNQALGHHLAYAVSTSGTTGIPKVVLISRRNISSNIVNLSEIYPHQAGDRLLQSCSPAFDVSVFEIFWTWHCGMTLCTASNDILFRDISMFIDRLDITHLSMTPTVATLVDPEKVLKLKFIVCAGEPMSQIVHDRWRHRGLHQGYGPSETTNICTLRSTTSALNPINNVGIPLPNTSMFICARQERERAENVVQTFPSLLPRGAKGEIWVGGAQVGRGYSDPSLTYQTWLDHPSYGRLYRSGDVGRILHDGSIMITGRTDDQIKMRGLRIELKEVASTAMTIPEVGNAICLKATNHETEELVLFCTANLPANDQCSIVQTVFRNLAQLLPHYMLPELIIPMNEFPISLQGKVDSAGLREIHSNLSQSQRLLYGRSDVDEDVQSRMNEQEAAIAKAVADVTKQPVEHIGKRISLFAVGIDSIRAIVLSNLLRRRGFVQVEVSTILRHASVSKLALYLKTHSHINEMERSAPSLSSRFSESWKESLSTKYAALGCEIECVLPTTSLQQAMLASTIRNSASRQYWNLLVYRLELRTDKMRTAWSTVVRRHALFRTVFVVGESIDMPYCQIVLRDVDLAWSYAHCSELKDEVTMDVLSSSPPYKFVLRETESGTLLELHVHHALYDAVAMDLVHAEIEAMCNQDQADQLEPPVPFESYLRFIARSDQGVLNNFWDKKLRNVKPCYLLSDVTLMIPSRSVCIHRSARLSLSAVEARARSSQATVLSLLQTALARLLNACLNTHQLCFGTVYSGRSIDLPGADRIVGPCFNTLPTPAYCGITQSNRELCRSLHDFNLQVLPHQATSLRLLSHKYAPKARTLFDCLLLFHTPSVPLNPNIWTLVSEQGAMDFPFIFEITPSFQEDEIKLSLLSQFDNASAAGKLLSLFDELIADTVMYPEMMATSTVALDDELINLFRQSNHRTNPSTTKGTIDGTEVLDERKEIVQREVIDIIGGLQSDAAQVPDASLTIFQLGLDSINAIQLVTALRTRGYDVSLADVLEHPHLGEIVELCLSTQAHVRQNQPNFDLDAFDKEWRGYITKSLDVCKIQVEAVWPCTATQNGMISKSIASGHKMYFNMILLSLERDVDINKLNAALGKMIERHLLLRTGFAETNNKSHPFAMVIYSPESSNTPWHIDGKEDSILEDEQQWLITAFQRGTPPWRINVETTACQTNLRMQIHHALYDASSLNIILQDVRLMYKNIILESLTPVAPTLSRILALNDAQDSCSLLYETLKDDAKLTLFPNLNPDNVSNLGFFIEQRISKISPLAISEGCKRLNCSFLAVCQATWAKILGSYLGQESISFGSVISGRSFEDSSLNNAGLPCINTTPICVQVAPDAAELLARIKAINAVSSRCQHASLSHILRILGTDGLLFDTILVLQQNTNDFDANDLWQVIEEKASAEYSVSVEIVRKMNGSMKLRVTARSDLLPRKQAEILLSQFDDMIADMLVPQNTPKSKFQDGFTQLSNLPASVATLTCNATTLYDLFLASAERTPDSTAFEFASSSTGEDVTAQSWTYFQLWQKSCQVANLIVSAGALVGDLIAVCFDKCPEAPFALLGVLAAGCGYVAIDPAAPQARKDFILQDAGCKILLTTSNSAWTIQNVPGVQVFPLDRNTELWNSPKSPPLLSRTIQKVDICYCLYTSGTTGKPKGCLISHESAVQAMMSFTRIFAKRWDKSSRWLQFAGLHFDVSVLEHFWSWSVGICVTSMARDELFEDLADNINALQITHLDLTPSLARLISPSQTPMLRKGVFIVGGEQVQQDIYDVWAETGCLFNFYGPSEVTIGCTFRQATINSKPSNIGHQWDNVSTMILKPQSEQIVQRGEIGELCLGGILLAKGYLNRPELTEEKFVTLKIDGQRVYRTGDLVRLLHDDSFDFLGRIDDQVKLRGQRLEIAEIDHVLVQSHADIRGAATLVTNHPGQPREQLVAFLATLESKSSSQKQPSLQYESVNLELIENVRQQAVSKLPGYMVPSQFIAIDCLPLTLNNKVDKKALKGFYQQIPLEVLQSSTARTSALIETSQSWLRLKSAIATYVGCNLDNVMPSSSLFELGIDSVSVLGLAKSVRTAGFHGATIETLLRHHQLQDLLEVLEKSMKLDIDIGSNKLEFENENSKFDEEAGFVISQLLSVAPENIEAVVPCTPLQAGMLTKVQIAESAEPPYMARFDFRLEQSVEIGRLVEAWKIVACKLAILRTRFVTIADMIAQVVLKAAAAPPQIVQSDEDGNSFKHFVTTAREFGMAAPWEVCFGTTTPGQINFMSVSAFHGIYDAISLPLLLEAVQNTYMGSANDVSIGPQFHEIVGQGYLESRENDTTFWREHLGSVRPLGLSSATEFVGGMQTLTTTLDLENLPSLCSRLKVTTQAVFHASWLLTLANYFNFSPTIGVVVSGRSIEVDFADRIIGPMFNTLPRTVTIQDPSVTVAEFINLCHSKNVETKSRQHTSLSMIRRWLNIPTDCDLFDSLFVFQNWPTTQPAQRLWTRVGSSTASDYPLNIEIEGKNQSQFQITINMTNGDQQPIRATDLLRTFSETLSGMENLLGSTLPECLVLKESKEVPVMPKALLHRIPNSDSEWNDISTAIRHVVADVAGTKVSLVSYSRPSIFELGLDSVDALKIASRLKAKGIHVVVSKIIKYPTVSGIHQHGTIANGFSKQSSDISQPTSEATGAVMLAQDAGIGKSDDVTVLHITPMQTGLLMEYEKYYHSLTYKIEDSTDMSRFTRALKQVVAECPILRTRFIEPDDSETGEIFLQIIDNDFIPSVEIYNIGQEVELDHYTSSMRSSRCALDAKPLVAILKSQDSLTYWTLMIHHALYDGMALALFHRRIHEVYFEKDSRVVSLTATKEFIAEARAAAANDRNAAFWRAQIHDAPSSIITAIDRQSIICPAYITSSFSNIPLKNVRKICTRYGITTQSVGLACWSLALAQLTKRLDICFGLVASGRMRAETQDLIFPTFNTVIFRPKLEPEVGKAKLLRAIHNLAGDIYEHQLFPLSKAGLFNAKPLSSLFNTLFTFQRRPETSDHLDVLYHERQEAGQAIDPPYAFNLEMEVVSDQLQWTIAVKSGIMSASQVDHVIKTLDHILAFLSQEDDVEALQLVSDKISICGMTPFEVSATTDETQCLEQEPENGVALSNAEACVRDTFARVSGTKINEISVTTTLFNLGLDSISSIKISNILRRAGWKVPVSQILQKQTVGGIANVAEKIHGHEITERGQNGHFNPKFQAERNLYDRLTAIGIDMAEVEGIMPTSGGQRYMLDTWRASRSRLSSATFEFEIQHCDEATLQSRLEQLPLKIPLLRTKFLEYDQEYYQVIFRGRSPSQTELPWSYSIQNSGDILSLSIDIHHALYDAVSLELIMRHLADLCTNDSVGEAPLLETDPRTFLEATTTLRVDERQRQQEFWTRYIGTRPKMTGKIGTFQSSRTELFDSDLLSVRPLLERLKKEGISLQAAFFTIAARRYAEGLRGHDKENDASRSSIIGIYLSNRMLDVNGLPVLAYPTFNIVPLKVELDGDVLAASRKVQQDLVEISRAINCGVCLRDIYKWTSVKLDCYINFLRLPEDYYQSEKETAGSVEIRHAQSRAGQIAQNTPIDKRTSPLMNVGMEDEERLDWCLPALDIEARVDNNDQLGVGVFSPSDMLDAEGVRGFMQALKEDLVEMIR